MKKFLLVLIALFLSVVFVACDENATTAVTTHEVIDYITPDVLEVQLIPSRDAAAVCALLLMHN